MIKGIDVPYYSSKFFNKVHPSMPKKILFFYSFIMTVMPVYSTRHNKSILQPDGECVYVYNWSNYLPKSVIDQFTKETGIKVIYDTFESPDALETKMVAGAAYDIVFPPLFPSFSRLLRSSCFRPLMQKWIPNMRRVTSPIVQKIPPKMIQYGVPYAWGTTGIGINRTQISAAHESLPMDSWGMLFDENNLKKLSDTNVSFLEGMDLIQCILIYLGHDPTSTDQKIWKKGLQYFEQIRPLMKKFDTLHQFTNMINAHTVVMNGYSTYINMAKHTARTLDDGPDINYVIPKEGAMIWIDMMAVPKQSHHPKNAHIFINFILQPRIMGEISNTIRAANAVPDSMPFMNQDMIQDPSIVPPDAVYDRLFLDAPYPASLVRYVTRLFMQIKSGHPVQWDDPWHDQ